MENNAYILSGYETFYGRTKEIKFNKKECDTVQTAKQLRDFPKNYNFDTCTVYLNNSAEYEWNSEDYTDTEIADNLLMAFMVYGMDNDITDAKFKFEVVLENECGSENLVILKPIVYDFSKRKIKEIVSVYLDKEKEETFEYEQMSDGLADIGEKVFVRNYDGEIKEYEVKSILIIDPLDAEYEYEYAFKTKEDLTEYYDV